MTYRNYNKVFLFGGVANFIIVLFFFIRNILLVRKLSMSIDLDSFLLGVSILQMFIYSILKMYLNSIQPNIANYKSKYIGFSLIIGLILLALLHLLFFIFHEFIFTLFNTNQSMELHFDEFIFYLLFLSLLQCLFIFFNGIINIVVNITTSLKLEILSNVFLVFLILQANSIKDIYHYYILNYCILFFITFYILIKKVTLKIHFNKVWLMLVISNMKNYFFSFLISLPTNWYEKRTLTTFNAGSITIFNLVTKAISPINNILINPSVLLSTFSNNNYIENKKILNKFLILCFVFLTFLISTLVFISELFQGLLSSLLQLGFNDSLKLINTFQIMTLSILPSVVYTGFQKFLTSMNKSNILFKINLISSLQLVFLYFLLQNFDIFGFVTALVINSYLSTLYVILFFILKLNIRLFDFFIGFNFKILTLVLLSIIYLIFNFTYSSSIGNVNTNVILYISLLLSYLLSIKTLRNVLR